MVSCSCRHFIVTKNFQLRFFFTEVQYKTFESNCLLIEFIQAFNYSFKMRKRFLFNYSGSLSTCIESDRCVLKLIHIQKHTWMNWTPSQPIVARIRYFLSLRSFLRAMIVVATVMASRVNVYNKCEQTIACTKAKQSKPNQNEKNRR